MNFDVWACVVLFHVLFPPLFVRFGLAILFHVLFPPLFVRFGLAILFPPLFVRFGLAILFPPFFPPLFVRFGLAILLFLFFVRFGLTTFPVVTALCSSSLFYIFVWHCFCFLFSCFTSYIVQEQGISLVKKAPCRFKKTACSDKRPLMRGLLLYTRGNRYLLII